MIIIIALQKKFKYGIEYYWGVNYGIPCKYGAIHK